MPVSVASKDPAVIVAIRKPNASNQPQSPPIRIEITDPSYSGEGFKVLSPPEAVQQTPLVMAPALQAGEAGLVFLSVAEAQAWLGTNGPVQNFWKGEVEPTSISIFHLSLDEYV